MAGSADSAASLPQGGQDEGKMVSEVWPDKMKEGDVFAVVDAKWWTCWDNYSGFNLRTREVSSPLVEPGVPSTAPFPRPGTLDNTPLLADGATSELRANLQEYRDFVLVPQAVWVLLRQWYRGSPEILREVVTIGLISKRQMVDLYPVFFKLVEADPTTGEPGRQLESFSMARSLTFADVLRRLGSEEAVGEMEDEDPEDAEPTHYASTSNDLAREEKEYRWNKRLWVRKVEESKEGAWEPVESGQLTISFDNFAYNGEVELMVESRGEKGWPRKEKRRVWTEFQVDDIIDCEDTVGRWYEARIEDIKEDEVKIHYLRWAKTWDEWIARTSERLAPRNTHSTPKKIVRDSYFYPGENEEGAPGVSGSVGLGNLGNTCFMNSTLQCVLNTPFLVDYFLRGEHLKHLNRNNPIGCKGRVAEEFGNLVKKVWSGKYRVVYPREFKFVLGEFQPRFSGYSQQDSQELLAFLLDGLHEDVNRVIQKPVTSKVESGNRPDAVVGEEAWRMHCLRNRSIIQEVVTGQLKSRVVCLECRMESTTFDPFNFVSVPLPDQPKVVNVTLIPLDPRQTPLRCYSVEVSKSACTSGVTEKLAKEAGIGRNQLVVADIYQHKVYKVMEHWEGVADLRSSDTLFAFQLPEYEEEKVEEKEKEKGEVEEKKEDANMGGGEGREGSVPSHPNESAPVPQESAPVFVDPSAPGFQPRPQGEGEGEGEGSNGGGGEGDAMELVLGENEEANESWEQPKASEWDDEFTTSGTHVALAQLNVVFGRSYYSKTKFNPDKKVLVSIRLLVRQKNPSYDPAWTYSKVRHVVITTVCAEGAQEFELKAFGIPLMFKMRAGASAGHVRRTVEKLLAPWLLESENEAVPYTLHCLGSQSCYYHGYSCDGCLLSEDENAQAFEGDRCDSYAYDPHKMSISVLFQSKEVYNSALSKVEEPGEEGKADENPAVRSRKSLLLLEDCLRVFTTEEVLSENDKVYCSHCRDFKQATKKLDLWRMPDVLIIHLKRFLYNSYWREKINGKVEFPIRGLDMSAFCVNPAMRENDGCIYDLYAVSNHFGDLGGGHYTAFAKNLLNNKWYNLDDSCVSELHDEESVRTEAAYVLFYKRRGAQQRSEGE